MLYRPMDTPKTKYSFEDTENGVRISREGGYSMEVFYKDTYIYVGDYSKEGLYTYGEITKGIGFWFANQLIKGSPSIIRDAAAIISRSLGHRFKKHWNRIVKEIAPPEIEKLSRLMFSSVRGDCKILHHPILYTFHFKHLRSDLAKYRACRLYAKAKETDIYANLPPTNLLYLDQVANWRNELSPTINYKGLNKTLDNLPTAISFKQIQRLSLMRLEQPILSRLHLIFALSCADHHNFGLHERAILNASEGEVIEACAVFNYGFNSRSRTSYISEVAGQIVDYPEAYHGNLLGLARRSREYHQNINRYTYRDNGFPDDFKLPAPPEIDLEWLKERGVFFLETVASVRQEGREMVHCVGGYASKAAKGLCYLFHVDHESVTATIEVSREGHVIQAFGSRNTKNKACDYGANMLRNAFNAPRSKVSYELAGGVMEDDFLF